MSSHPELLDPDLWCALPDVERRARLAAALLEALQDAPGVSGAHVRVGPVERPYDLTAVAETDVGELRTALWSHARAVIFCDPSVHPANRRQLAPGHAVAEAAARLRARLGATYTLESRGLSVTLAPEPGVERAWTAERSLFRGKTSVTREDRVTAPTSGDLDLRDLLAHFYTGPSLRVAAADGTAFLLPAAGEPDEGPLVSLCQACHQWAEGPHAACPHCGGPADTVVAVRPARR